MERQQRVEQAGTAVSLDRFRAQILFGVERVVACLPQLLAKAGDWQQTAEIADLAYFLSRPSSFPVTPTLVLLWPKAAVREEASLLGAVLLSRYRGFLTPFRLYLSADRRGRRVVFGPASARVEVAACAAQALLEHGARFISLHVDEGEALPGDSPSPAPELERLRALTGLRLPGLRDAAAEWSLHTNSRPSDLPLASTYAETVARLGPNTRRNLRRYTRRCAEQLGATFVTGEAIPQPVFLSLNAASTHPSPRRIAQWRLASLRTFPNTFVAGLRTPEGQWLALLGGRRNQGAVEVDWQMNRKGYERYALSTALRSALIENEVRRGESTSLSLEGGSQHTMVFSFRRRQVVALTVRRPSVELRLLAWVLRRYFPNATPTLALPHPARTWQSCLLSRRSLKE